MKRLLTKVYDWLGIETNAWNWMQLLFGKHYLGALLIAILITLFCSNYQPTNCTYYKYRVTICDTGSNCYFDTDSISWEHGMLVAIDYKGEKRMVKPIRIKEGAFKRCK